MLFSARILAVSAVSLLFQAGFIYAASFEFADTAAESFVSTKIDGLLVPRAPVAARVDLVSRQGKVCSIPGGPICDSIHCCAPGQECCPGGCCPTTSACFQTMRCCPLTSTKCPGDTACCPPGFTCCGKTCCSSGEFCERGQCHDNSLKNSVARFELDPKENKELLENMCEGMKRGNGGVKTNTEKLTYRGKERGGESRGPIRRKAGCVDGYCANSTNNGGNPLFNSCDEYPPASSLEGGDFRLPSERIIKCIPGLQNSRQGSMFSKMLSQYKKANGGTEMVKNDEFVISIDCDSILPELQGRAEFGDTGNGGVDSDLQFSDVSESYVLVALGDLSPGTYDVTVQGITGSTTGGFVFDSEGDETFATVTSPLTVGQSQQYTFAFNDPMFGVAIALSTLQNNTNVTWSLGGSTSTPGLPTSTSISFSPTSLPGGGGATSAAHAWNLFGGYSLKAVVAGLLSMVVVGFWL